MEGRNRVSGWHPAHDGGMMKKISVLIPCYNEEENVEPISQAVLETLNRDLPE